MNPLKNKLPLLINVLIMLFTGTAHAEKADRDQPIHIEADVMNLDDATHISTFTGKVKLTQGTLRFTGDKLVVTEDAAGNKSCLTTGHLASFRQKRDNVNEYVEGYGERIEYNSLKGTVDFYVQARVKREQDDVRGDHITYSTQTEIFHVSGQPNSGRVRAVIQPKKAEN
jgi:lipopolysaccharide export system protein LptA